MSTKKKTSPDYHDLAKKRGFKWLGHKVYNGIWLEDKVYNSKTKTSWQCPQGHEWEAIYNSVQQGHGCPICNHGGITRKVSGDYHDLAKERGFKWIGPEVKNAHNKTGWQCSQGHQWQAIRNSIKQGSGCPFCYFARNRKTPVDYRTMAKERGFEWIGPEVPNNYTKTGWQCPNGHQWQAIYASIYQGSGCPFCSGRHKV